VIRSCALLVLLALAACRPYQRPDPLPGFPPLVLWAWERPENLSYLVPSATGVAYLIATVLIIDSQISIRPRMQPLVVPPGTALLAVVRIEDRGHGASVQAISNAIADLTDYTRFRGLQIDYDAPKSRRDFYRDILLALRTRLPQNVPLEMTALVSWCQDDRWFRGAPIVEAVPMFFRMGVDPHSPRESLKEPLCQSSFGLSTDEFYIPVPRVRRVFVFSRHPWTESSYRAILQASKKWFAN
jgi:Protein of unknown function (DUF3142).